MWLSVLLLLCTFPRTPSGTKLTKVFHFIFVNIFLNDTFKKQKKKKSRMVIIFFHSTAIYNNILITSNVEKEEEQKKKLELNTLLQNILSQARKIHTPRLFPLLLEAF